MDTISNIRRKKLSTAIIANAPSEPEKAPPIKVRAMTDEIRKLAIDLFALGFTVRTIRQQVIDRLNVELSESQLMQLAIAYAPEVELARREVSKMALQAGLADKGVRVARLNLLADAWANRAETSEKAAQVYLKTIDQINHELEPLGMRIMDPELDSWGKLLMDIRDKASPSPTTPPALTEGSNAERE